MYQLPEETCSGGFCSACPGKRQSATGPCSRCSTTRFVLPTSMGFCVCARVWVSQACKTGLTLGHAWQTGLALGHKPGWPSVTLAKPGWPSGGKPTLVRGGTRAAHRHQEARCARPKHQRTNAPKHQTTNAPKHHPPYALLPKSQALRPEPEERALAGDELMVSVPSGSTLARAARVRTPVPSWFTINDSGMLRKSILAPPRPPALAPSALYLSQPL